MAQPHKGPRRAVISRVPTEDYETYKRLARAAGLSVSEWAGATLAHSVKEGRYPRKKHLQTELPLSA